MLAKQNWDSRSKNAEVEGTWCVKAEMEITKENSKNHHKEDACMVNKWGMYSFHATDLFMSLNIY